ncbi:MAG: hypothetical protein AAF039_07150 [Bacteroidota bacterium]
MKRILQYMAVSVLLITQIGCDLLEEASDRDLDIPITITLALDVAVAEAAGSMDVSTSFESSLDVFDILSAPEVSSRIAEPDAISRIRVTGATYEYTNFSGNVDAVMEGNIRFGSGGIVGLVDFATAPVNVANADLLGDRFTLDGDFENLSNKLTNGISAIAAVYEGNSSHNPVLVQVLVTVNAVITVDLDFSTLRSLSQSTIKK